ncbi:hypothetical protein [Streptomyces mirabilis]|uniref:hypothetical protein n=1 Tax=Streptomyces mirabilis TaxID=68239 RepID=UPI00224CE71E|nr:hypothetical protein [Streptomyces mirabilis]MCX4609479.1 hypothetical protein [Streptomyces mirabilis]
MTRTSKVLLVVFGAPFVFSISVGGQLIGEARWWHATAAYAVAGLCLIGLLREMSRATLLGDYTDDIDEASAIPEPGLRIRARAARQARQVTRNMPCGCHRYWSSAGTEHDIWCPHYERSSA